MKDLIFKKCMTLVTNNNAHYFSKFVEAILISNDFV